MSIQHLTSPEPELDKRLLINASCIHGEKGVVGEAVSRRGPWSEGRIESSRVESWEASQRVEGEAGRWGGHGGAR
jgi:hypothetical protein